MRRWALLPLALTLALLLGWTDGRGRLEAGLADHLAALEGRAASTDLVIIAIDERSLQALGRWPWRRTVHAALIDRLRAAGVRAVGLDVILSEPAAMYPADDALLAEAMGRVPVVLPLIMTSDDQGRPEASLPAAPLAAAAAALGHIHVELDPDGVARSVFLREGTQGRWWTHFAPALLAAAGLRPPGAPLPGLRRPPSALATGPRPVPSSWLRDHWVQVPYAGPPGHFARWSYVDVLEGRVDPQALQGKVVLVGATAVGLGDAYPTPLPSQNGLMPGVEISANVADALLQDRWLRRAQPWENAALAVVLTAALWGAGRRTTPGAGLLVLAAAMVMAFTVSWLALRVAGVQFALPGALGALAATHALLTWQRLERARHRQALQSEREAAWRFISHDMRSPLSSILALVRLHRSAAGEVDEVFLARVEDHATRSLAMAEDYVSMSRAQQAAAREPVDLRDVVADTVDAQWSRAVEQRVNLRGELPEGEAVVRGDRALLVRAMSNLVDNALKFTPPGSSVRCVLHAAHPAQWELGVHDEGPGVTDDMAAALFDPYRQGEPVGRGGRAARGHEPQGVGLGLALVKVVAEKHGGQAGVRAAAGAGAVFFIRLPRA